MKFCDALTHFLNKAYVKKPAPDVVVSKNIFFN